MGREFFKGTVDSWQEHNRPSSRRQYESVWAAFVHFLNIMDVQVMSEETVCAFLRYFFFVRGLSPKRVTSYKTGIAKPVLIA